MAPQKYTEARKSGNKKWDAANLDRLSIALPKGSRGVIQAHAEAHSESINGFIKRAISETMARDNAIHESAKGHTDTTEEAGE